MSTDRVKIVEKLARAMAASRHARLTGGDLEDLTLTDQEMFISHEREEATAALDALIECGPTSGMTHELSKSLITGTYKSAITAALSHLKE